MWWRAAIRDSPPAARGTCSPASSARSSPAAARDPRPPRWAPTHWGGRRSTARGSGLPAACVPPVCWPRCPSSGAPGPTRSRVGLPRSRGWSRRRPREGPGTAPPAVQIMAGVGAAARSVGASVLGGDLVRSPRYLVDVCVLGVAERPVRRSGARPGDGLWVTGRLGGAGLALAALRAGRGRRGGRLAPALRRRFARPTPRIAAGRWLARRGARAMIDISDGLAGDAGHLAAASGVGVAIELERVPCWPGVTPFAAVRSGEEYELLVAMPRRFGPADAKAVGRG